MYKFQKRIMVKTHKVEGFDAFKAKVEELAGSGADVFVMFSGSKNAAGVSWCPDCVGAEPVVNVSCLLLLQLRNSATCSKWSQDDNQCFFYPVCV